MFREVSGSPPGQALPNRRRRRQRRRQRQRQNFCVFAFLLAGPLFRCETIGCDALVTPSCTRRLRRAANQSFKENRRIPRSDPDPFVPSTRESLAKLKTTENEMEGERIGSDGRNEAAETEEAERKKWGQEGTYNVYEDLENLERAIRLENAEFKLRHEILQEKVDYIDQSKRKVVPDAFRFLIVPLAYSFGLFRMASSNRAMVRTISQSATRVMDLHFWIFVVWAPVLLNATKRIAKPPPDPVPDELATVDVDSVPVGYWASSPLDWKDPNEDCNDSVLFLTEYWTSAVNGMVYLQALKAVATMVARRTTGAGLGSVFRSDAMMLWLACAQVLTRIAAVVSVYQYPEKMYDFERSQLTRPVGFFPTAMWKLLRAMMLLAPLGVISDFSKVLLLLPKGAIYPLYGSVAVLLYGTWARMQESVLKNKKDPLDPTRLKSPKPLAKLAYVLGYLVMWRKQLRVLGLQQKLTNLMEKLVTNFYGVFWKAVGLGLLLPLPLAGPLVHIGAFRKIFEVQYVNDLPPLSTAESYRKAIDENPQRAYDMAWRYSLRWRPPQRLGLSKAMVYNEAVYRCLVKGTAVDLLEQLSAREYDDESLQRLLKQRPARDHEHWKARAMEFQARKHQRNYESGKMDDPLGVAVWKALGIGLGFNFDHMRELEDGEDPSPRRLQARAAKSAVRRYNELYAEEQALIRENESLDPEERDESELAATRQRFDDEIRYLAGRLTELVPTSSRLEEFGFMEVAKFRMKKEPAFRKVSANEIRMLEEDPLGSNDPDPASESATLLNNLRYRRHDTSRNYRKLLEDDDNDNDGDNDSDAGKETNRNDRTSNTDGARGGSGGNQNNSNNGNGDDDDDDSTGGFMNIEYV